MNRFQLGYTLLLTKFKIEDILLGKLTSFATIDSVALKIEIASLLKFFLLSINHYFDFGQFKIQKLI